MGVHQSRELKYQTLLNTHHPSLPFLSIYHSLTFRNLLYNPFLINMYIQSIRPIIRRRHGALTQHATVGRQVALCKVRLIRLARVGDLLAREFLHPYVGAVGRRVDPGCDEGHGFGECA